MAPKAAPGREKLRARIQRVQSALNHRRAQINHYLSWVARQEAELPAAPAIKKGTSLVSDTRFLENIVNFLNARVDLLRRKGCPLDDSWTLDAGFVLAQCMKPPRGTEMGNVVVKRAAVEAEGTLRYVIMELDHIERTQVWDWINTVVNVATGCVGREIEPTFGIWMRWKIEKERLRERLEGELNPEAVWLKAKRERLEDLQTKLAAAKWQSDLEGHERIVWELFEEASALGIKVGQRQTLVTEYFSKISSGEGDAEA